jgi:hypothetical protein
MEVSMPTTYPPLATVEELAIRVREEIDTDDELAIYFLRAASATVRQYVGSNYVNDAGDTLVDVPDVAHDITIEVAARVWMNPEGNTQETAGPFTERRPELYADSFFLTGTEKSKLGALRGSGLGGLWTFSTTRGDNTVPYIEVPVVPQPGEPIPYYAPGTPGAQGL